jgi:hypothetical protein
MSRPRSPRLSLAAGALAVALLASAASACDPVRFDAKSAHDSGAGKAGLYDATYEQAWAAAHAALRWSPVGDVIDHPDEHYLITDDVHFDQVGMWFLPFGPNQTQVKVVVIDNRRSGPTERSLLDDIARAVERIKSGQSVERRP